MSAYFDTVMPDPSRVENNYLPLGSDNTGDVIVKGVAR